MTFHLYNIPWIDSDAIPAAAVNLIESQLVEAIDGADGGGYSPTNPINIGGAGLQDICFHRYDISATPFTTGYNIIVDGVAGHPHRLYIKGLTTAHGAVSGLSLFVELPWDDVDGATRTIFIDFVPANLYIFAFVSFPSTYAVQATRWNSDKVNVRIDLVCDQSTTAKWVINGVYAEDSQENNAVNELGKSWALNTSGTYSALLTGALTFVLGAPSVGAPIVYCILDDHLMGEEVTVRFSFGAWGKVIIFVNASSPSLSTNPAVLTPVYTYDALDGYDLNPLTFVFRQTGAGNWALRESYAAAKPSLAYNVAFASLPVVANVATLTIPKTTTRLITVDAFDGIYANSAITKIQVKAPANNSLHEEVTIKFTNFSLNYGLVSANPLYSGLQFEMLSSAGASLFVVYPFHRDKMPGFSQNLALSPVGPYYTIGGAPDSSMVIKLLCMNNTWSWGGVS